MHVLSPVHGRCDERQVDLSLQSPRKFAFGLQIARHVWSSGMPLDFGTPEWRFHLLPLTYDLFKPCCWVKLQCTIHILPFKALYLRTIICLIKGSTYESAIGHIKVTEAKLGLAFRKHASFLIRIYLHRIHVFWELTEARDRNSVTHTLFPSGRPEYATTGMACCFAPGSRKIANK